MEVGVALVHYERIAAVSDLRHQWLVPKLLSLARSGVKLALALADIGRFQRCWIYGCACAR